MSKKEVYSDKREVARQIFHLILGLFIVLAIQLFAERTMIIILSIITVVGLLISLWSRDHKIPIIYKLLERFDRHEDMKVLPGKGAIFFFLGCSVALFMFGKTIASASIMILAIGDSFNYLIGKPFGRIKTPLSDKKFLEGAIAGWLLASLGAMLFVNVFAAIVASFTAMLIEFMDIGKRSVNDNFLIPIIAGIVLIMLA